MAVDVVRRTYSTVTITTDASDMNLAFQRGAMRFVSRIIRESKDLAVRNAPVGVLRPGDPNSRPGTLKRSHFAGSAFARAPLYARGELSNNARHAQWVHEGTMDSPRNGQTVTSSRIMSMHSDTVRQAVMGPIPLRSSKGNPKFYTGRWYRKITWRGQRANPWMRQAVMTVYRRNNRGIAREYAA